MQWKNNSGVAFIAAVLGMLAFGTLGLTLASLVSNRYLGSTEKLQSAQAFYVAEGGVQSILMSQFNGDSDFSDNISPTDPPFGATSISLAPGQFWVEYLNQQATSVDIRVTARVGQAVREVRVSVGQGGTGIQTATMSDGNLSIINSSGNIFGDVVLSGNYTIEPGVTVNGNITQDGSLEIPPIDFNTYESMTTSTHYGSLAISSNYTGDLHVTGSVVFYGDVTYNGLLYVDGSIAFQGSSTVINGTVVAEGNIAIQNSGNIQVISQPNPLGHMPAILAGGNLDIQITNNVDIQGAIWANENIEVQNIDDFDLTGAFLTGGNMAMSNIPDLNITFDSDLVAQIPGMTGGSGSMGLSLANWQTY